MDFLLEALTNWLKEMLVGGIMSNLSGMTRFTDSPYERMMTRRPEGGRETSRPPSLPHNHPCYGCGSYGSPCVGICHREMERWLKERKRKK